jgi:hypothetical protein
VVGAKALVLWVARFPVHEELLVTGILRKTPGRYHGDVAEKVVWRMEYEQNGPALEYFW